MFADLDWYNLCHVCIGNRDNLFLCLPGTISNDTKQDCMNRYNGINCNGTRSYYKPTTKRQKRIDLPSTPRQVPVTNHRFADIKRLSMNNNHHQRIPFE
ncbi:hypothetical protein I4U23_006265 [Adineta vaga]|nr:hypothetical protein I4U23_006265 [Adineta vaga]